MILRTPSLERWLEGLSRLGASENHYLFTIITRANACVKLAQHLEAEIRRSRPNQPMSSALDHHGLFRRMLQIKTSLSSIEEQIYSIGERAAIDNILGPILPRAKLTKKLLQDAIYIAGPAMPILEQKLREMKRNLKELEELIKSHSAKLHIHFEHWEKKSIIEKLRASTRDIEVQLEKMKALKSFFDSASPLPDTLNCLESILSKFTQYIRDLSDSERMNPRFEETPIWKYIDGKEELVQGYHRRRDPGDGDIYRNEDFAKTKYVLQMFDYAWKIENSNKGHAYAAHKLPEMAKICLVLKTLKQKQAIDDFLKSKISDNDLPVEDISVLENLLGAYNVDAQSSAESFSIEQYRAVPRQWSKDEIKRLKRFDTLPFKQIAEIDDGSYGHVSRVEDVFSGKVFARKIQKEPGDKADTLFKQEIDLLKRLRGHRHVVALEKAYRRDHRYAILLSAGEDSLSRVLKQLHEAHHAEHDRFDSLASKLLRAFGCLSSGLMYLHSEKVRHKDIKPDNILYTSQESGQFNFFFIDFNISYDFSTKPASRTHNKSPVTAMYAAPEMIRWIRDEMPGLQEDKHPEGRAWEKDDTQDHGRSADVWSLGIVFLEILSVLCKEDYLSENPKDDTFWGCKKEGLFFDSIDLLHSWADTKIKKLTKKRGQSPLIPVFEICKDMIKKNEWKRPEIAEVIKRFRANGEQYFCEECLSERKNPTE